MRLRTSVNAWTLRQSICLGLFAVLSTWLLVVTFSKPVRDLRKDVFTLVQLGKMIPILGLPRTFAEKFHLKVKNEVLVHTPLTYFDGRIPEAKPIRLLCWITTFHSTANFKKTHAVRSTWAKKCDKFLVMSAKYRDDSYPDDVISLNVSYQYDKLWERTVLAFTHVWNNYKGQFDFVLKADDDSYIFVENLREFLGPFAPNEKLFFGFPYLSQDFGTYMSGGSGYVLSHESLRQFHGQILNRTDIFADFFSWYTPPEDSAVGMCMDHVNATFVAGLDEDDRLMFTPLKADVYKDPKGEFPSWYRNMNRAKMVDGSNHTKGRCCSEKLISMHYVASDEMFMVDMLNKDVKTVIKKYLTSESTGSIQ